MSELEQVEREYRALATKLIYQSYRQDIDPADQLRLNQLSDRRVRLSAPDWQAAAA